MLNEGVHERLRTPGLEADLARVAELVPQWASVEEANQAEVLTRHVAAAEMLTIVLRGEGFDTAVVGDGTRALPAVRDMR
ncbi:hypothetical protein AB0B41_30760, partial [Pseudonocardia sp. NPDC049154]